MKQSAEYWVDRLKLEPHPEGGFFKETYRSSLASKYEGFPESRNVSTGIYFLLMAGNFSGFHRIKSDEIWHFYAGDPISIYVIYENGEMEEISLGLDLDQGERPQAIVPANCWFASQVKDDGAYGLVGCTVAPGFDFQDFELAKRSELLEQFSQHSELILALTRG